MSTQIGQQELNDISASLDHYFNPDQKNKTIGYILLTFDYNTTSGSTLTNYTSNGNRESMINLMEDLIKRLRQGQGEPPISEN